MKHEVFIIDLNSTFFTYNKRRQENVSLKQNRSESEALRNQKMHFQSDWGSSRLPRPMNFQWGP